MACWGLREAPHQVCRLQPSAIGPADQPELYDPLAGCRTVGVHPLLADDDCHFLAVDFNDADWQADQRQTIRMTSSTDLKSRKQW